MLLLPSLQESLSEGDVDALLHQLWEYKQELAERQREASLELLLHFLQSSRRVGLVAGCRLVPLVLLLLPLLHAFPAHAEARC